MESLRRKRKGLEILPSSGKSLPPLTVILSHFSLGDYSRQRKKYKEGEDKEVVGSGRSVVKGVFTVPPYRSVFVDPSCRGLKRKIGCIDAATQLGRKKKIEEEYDLGAYIGQGKFGSVVLCRSKVTGEVFACKMLRKGEELVHREVEIMQHLSGHPGVVTLKAVYEDLESFYLVMELCPEGRLLDKMAKERQYPEHRAANILKEIVSVIKYCHDMGVVHRDIKPENILLATSGQMKLADFGLAVRMSNGNNDFVNISVVFRYIQAHSHIPGYTSVCILYLSDLFFYFSNSFYFYCLLYAQRFSNIFRILHFFNTGVISAVMFLCRLDYVLCALISKLVFLSCRSEPQRCSWKPCLCCPRSFSRWLFRKVDIWSAGVLLHALLVGVLPFQGDSLEAVFEAIKKVNLDFKSELWESVSQPARDLIAHMLTRDVSARLTADEILGHPWIMFYTEPTQKELTPKSKFQDHVTLTSQQLTLTTELELDRSKITANGFLSDDCSPLLSSDGSRSRLEEHDCGLIDALTAAISRVRISEPKRSRLCWPTSPIRQECSSNIKINNLCTAF